MEELEDPTESLHEHIHEGAHHAEGDPKSHWIIYVALSTAIIAVLSAITGLMAAHHADESVLSQIRASDKWNYYQAKGIKTDILLSETKILKAMGKAPIAADTGKTNDNKKQQQEIMKQAKDEEADSRRNAQSHGTLARSVTLFQISIAIAAVSILVKKKVFWFASLGFAAVAAFFFVMELVS